MTESARQRQFEDQFLAQLRARSMALTRGKLPADEVIAEQTPEGIDAIRDELLAGQETDGRWLDSGFSDDYGTAMACLVLQTPLNYLPIIQR